MSSLRRCTRPLAPARPRRGRRCSAVPALLAGLLVIAAAPASAVGYDDAGYLAYADRMQERLDRLWDERRGLYRPSGGGSDTLINASLLLTHSVAAHAGHSGPARNDARARSIARALVLSPAFIERPAAHPAVGSQPHAPGWTSAMHDDQAPQHVMIDAQIIDALVHAWQARHQLGMSARTARLIADRIHRVARCRFWRWPRIRLNQINWYALVYAADATVTGDPTLLRHDLRAQLRRFIFGRHNFGAGLRFHYLPQRAPAAPANVDSAEYANIVLSFLRFYDQARHAGMAPLPRVGRALIRRWIRRAIAGYWTHGGYLNWDAGLGFERWHLGKKFGLAQQALIGIAQTPRLQPGRAWGRWAKWTFNRGLDVYERLPVTETGLPAPVLFGLYSFPQSTGDAQLTASQLEANAARAVDAGLGHLRGEVPPSLYAFDPDIGRLAITTPTYNTAIIAVNQRAFPYGGIELARLFDADQDVAANVGGRAPSAFGLLVRTPSGAPVFASQTGRARVDPEVTPVRLTRAPAGTSATAQTKPGPVFAGPFRRIRARGVFTAGRFRAITSHRFTEAFIDTYWRLDRLRGRARLRADVIFPSWGRGATVSALLRDGTRVRISAGRAMALAGIVRFEISSAGSGYAVAPLRRPRGAIAHVILPSRQSSQPDPGPTLAVELARGARWSRARFAARIRVHRR
jgi:hypothetical protein